MPKEPVPAIAVRNIHKHFGASHVLRGVSLDILPGQVVSILGSSGSGKTTLLRCMNLLEAPDEGTIRVAGEMLELHRQRRGGLAPVRPAQIDRIRTGIGMVFQGYHLWSHLTILENIIEGPVHVQKRPPAECIEEAMALLSQVGIADKHHHYPVHLSGGQQQRAAIARALAMRPHLMLFDEPTSALDPERVGEIATMLRELAAGGRALAIVTHEMEFARRVSDRVAFMHLGQIEVDGSPEEVLNGDFARLFRRGVGRAAP